MSKGMKAAVLMAARMGHIHWALEDHLDGRRTTTWYMGRRDVSTHIRELLDDGSLVEEGVMRPRLITKEDWLARCARERSQLANYINSKRPSTGTKPEC